MSTKSDKDEVKQYVHDGQKRINNPPVGLVTAETDHLNGKKTYSFDQHLDPQLQWAGKTFGLYWTVPSFCDKLLTSIEPLVLVEATMLTILNRIPGTLAIGTITTIIFSFQQKNF